MKIDIISGFLGAGKTRLIKKIIEEGLSEQNTVVIENEFGEVGIDGDFLKEYDIQVREIISGCICCSTATTDFRDALKEAMKSKKVQRIIIEPSGVAKLSEIIKLVETFESEDKKLLNMIITVVDVTMFEDYIGLFSEFYKDHIHSAKTIVLSRTQYANAQKLESVVTKIKDLNQNANIVTTPWEIISGKSIVKVGENNINFHQDQLNNLLIPADEIQEREHEHNHTDHDVFDNLAIETSEIYTEKILKDIFANMKDKNLYGQILRLKGIVRAEKNNWIAFDFEPNQFEIRNSKPKDIGRICFIGTHLNKDKLSNLF